MLLLLGTVACQSQSRCGEELFMVTEGSSLSLTRITAGNKLVFEYVCQTKNFRETIKADRGKRESILFEATRAITRSFSLTSSCSGKRQNFPHLFLSADGWEQLRGTIEGRQTAPGQWEVKIDVAAADAEGREVIRPGVRACISCNAAKRINLYEKDRSLIIDMQVGAARWDAPPFLAWTI